MDTTGAQEGCWLLVEDSSSTVLVAQNTFPSFEAEVSRIGLRKGPARVSYLQTSDPIIRVDGESTDGEDELVSISITDGCSISILPSEAADISSRIDEGSVHFRTVPEKSFVVIPLDNIFMVLELSDAVALSDRLDEMAS